METFLTRYVLIKKIITSSTRISFYRFKHSYLDTILQKRLHREMLHGKNEIVLHLTKNVIYCLLFCCSLNHQKLDPNLSLEWIIYQAKKETNSTAKVTFSFFEIREHALCWYSKWMQLFVTLSTLCTFTYLVIYSRAVLWFQFTIFVLWTYLNQTKFQSDSKYILF